MVDEGTPAAPPPTHEEQVHTHNVQMIQNQIDSNKFTLPEQFESAESFVNSYKELQGHATRATQELAENKKAVEDLGSLPEADPVKPVTDLKQELLQPADESLKTESGLDWTAIDSELKDSGDLSEATRKAITDSGIPADMVQGKIDTHKRAVADGAKEAAELVGGDKELKELLTWGRENLNENDQRILAEQLNGAGWKLSLMGLRSMKDSTAPKHETKEPNEIVTGGTPPTGTAATPPFTNIKEMRAAMGDPRYSVDTEYTNYVMGRMVASQGTLINAKMVDKVRR